jgi:superfamily II DNA/RNA helicase
MLYGAMDLSARKIALLLLYCCFTAALLLFLLLQTQVGCSACMLYGAMDPSARKISVARFRAKLCQYMVVTDVAARGVDIPLLENVLLLLLYCCFTAA